MNLLFVHPVDPDFIHIQQRYQAYSRVLYQRNQIVCGQLDSRRFLDRKNGASQLCEEADAIIIHVAVIPFAAKEIQHWKAHDKTVLVDVSSPVYEDCGGKKFVVGHKEIYIQTNELGKGLLIDKDQFIWSLKLTDGMIINSEIMHREWNGVIKTRYIPDYLDLDSRLIHPKTKKETIQIGVIICSGGFKQLIDCGVYPALEKTLNHSPNTKAILFGEHPHMAHMLKVPPNQKLFIPLIERDQWTNQLQSIDVCVLPFNGGYDLRCGRMEILELMSMRIPWVASESQHILPLQQYGWMIKNDPEIWNRILTDLILHLDNYHGESSEAYLYALSQGLEENAYHLVEYLNELQKS